jgi:hypothetical protein
VLGVLGDVDFGLLGGWLLLPLDEVEREGVGEQRGELLLEVVGFPGVLVDVVLDGDLN